MVSTVPSCLPQEEQYLYFLLLKHMLLLAEAVWIHAGIHPLNAVMCCKNLTEDAGRISLAHVFVHKAEKMQLRCNRNYSRSVADL